MKRNILQFLSFLLLFILSIQQQVLIFQTDLANQTGTNGQTIIDRTDGQYSRETRSSGFPFQDNVNWIWSNDINQNNMGIRENFQLICEGNPITIFANADDRVNISINDLPVIVTPNDRTYYLDILNATMSPSNFRIGGVNQLLASGYSDGNNPGVAYQVVQDQGEYEEECGLNLFNSLTCKYECKKPLVWYGAPICECNCPYEEMCGPGFSWDGKRSSYKHGKG